MRTTYSTALDATIDLMRLYLEHNKLAPEELPGMVSSVYTALSGSACGATTPPPASSQALVPAVSAAESVTDDNIICLEDGSNHKMMKGYLRRVFGLTPDQYRVKWGLPMDYPMTAAGYSEIKRREARSIGLGTRASKRGTGGRKAG